MTGRRTPGSARSRTARRQRRRPVATRDVVVGGRRTVAEAIRAGLAHEVLISPTARATPGMRDLLAEAERAGVRLRETEVDLLDTLTPDSQGVAARVRIPRPLGERELRSWSFAPDAVVVVLDGVTDPQNVGAAARVA